MNSLQSKTPFSMAETIPDIMPQIHWYAVSTKPHQETVAEMNIRRLGVETFCPQLKQQKMIRRKQQTCTVPLFPGYLFARFEMDHHYRFILYSRGIKRIVSFGEEPAIVEDNLIEGIRSRLQDGRVLESGSEFCQGQVVRIEDGPLHGLEAIFEREMTGAQRAVLLLKALSYQARVVVDLKAIVNL
jgi:transcriptional antiterminator RfaH